MNTNEVKKVENFGFNASYQSNPSLIQLANDKKLCMEGSIADCVFPRVTMPSCMIKYVDFTNANYEPVNDFFGDKSQIHEVGFKQHEYKIVQAYGHALEHVWGACDLGTIDAPCSEVPANYAEYQTEYLTELVLLNREVRVANIINNTSTYDASLVTNLSGAITGGGSVIDLITDVSQGTGCKRYRQAAMTRNVFNKLRKHPEALQDANALGLGTEAQVAAMLDVGSICIADICTVKNGVETPVYSDFLLFFNSPTQTPGMCVKPAFGFSGSWRGFQVRTKFDQDLGLFGAERVQAGEYIREVVMGNKFAHYFYNL